MAILSNVNPDFIVILRQERQTIQAAAIPSDAMRPIFNHAVLNQPVLNIDHRSTNVPLGVGESGSVGPSDPETDQNYLTIQDRGAVEEYEGKGTLRVTKTVSCTPPRRSNRSRSGSRHI